jgi:hypothetical protein
MNTNLQYDISVPLRETDPCEELRLPTEPGVATPGPVAADSERFAMLQRGARALEQSWSSQRAVWEKLAAWRRAIIMAREAARPRVPLTSQDD